MNPLIKRLALALLVVSFAVASATPVAAAERGHFTKTPLAGPWYTPQELKALTAYSNASFAQKKALLAGGNAATHDAWGADARHSPRAAMPALRSEHGAGQNPTTAAPLTLIGEHGAGQNGPILTAQPGAGAVQPSAVTIVEPSAFDWGDAGVGAAGAFGLTLLASGLLIVSRHGRRRVP